MDLLNSFSEWSASSTGDVGMCMVLPFANPGRLDAVPVWLNVSCSFLSSSNRLLATRSVPTGMRSVSQCYSGNTAASVADLKAQLETLQAEAEQARARANAARARFMRLTEAVENLQSRAALEMRGGREDSATQLIAEKKKIMRVLEKSKQRAELLEEFSIKLCEAISMKEMQLMDTLSLVGLRTNEKMSVANVRIISPKEGISLSNKGGEVVEGANREVLRCNDLDVLTSEEASNVGYVGDNVLSEGSASTMLSTRADLFLKFLAQIDDQLSEVDAELRNFMTIATIILSVGVEKFMNEKVAVVEQIHQDIRSARSRIQNLNHKE